MCSIDYAEPADVLTETHPTARKRHRCIECFRWIEPGERYRHVSCLYDGHWDTLRSCRHCEAASGWLHRVCGGYLHGGLIEEMVEHWDEGYRSVGMGRLIVGMRRRWRDGADDVPDRDAVRVLAESMMAAQVAA